MEKTSQITRKLLSWFRDNARDLPWRRTQDPYAIWISEVMLQQTQVKTVIPYWERWMRVLPTIESLARVKSQRLHKLWEGLGYYSRVRNLQKAARLIVERHGGRFPDRFEEVLALPGVGRYTAGAICSMAFNQPTPVLDGNVTRVLTRLYCVRANSRAPKTRERLWKLAQALVREASRGCLDTPETCGRPAGANAGPCSALNQALMELGATVCIPRNPKCELCPVSPQCQARARGWENRLPKPGRTVAAIRRRQLAFVVERNGRYLVRRRPDGGVNARLWEFPNSDANGGAKPGAMARATLGAAPRRLRRLLLLQHSITRYLIQLEVYYGVECAAGRVQSGRGRWLTLKQMRHLPFAAAHGRIVRELAARRCHRSPENKTGTKTRLRRRRGRTMLGSSAE